MDTATTASTGEVTLAGLLRGVFADGHERSLRQLRAAVGNGVGAAELARELSKLLRAGEVIR
ncbi:MAG: hypothetical protein WCP28_21780, partial [Actinomycetes bacterium]